jgi:hypothetical protein
MFVCVYIVHTKNVFHDSRKRLISN